MSITYGGFPLLLQNDSDGGVHLDSWLQQYLPLAEFIDQCEESAIRVTGRQAQSRAAAFDGGQVALRGVAPINYPPTPKMKLNSLYWPTGAARWGRFYGLATGTVVDAIATSLGKKPEPLPLVLADPENGREIVAERMWMLQPRRLNPGNALDGTPFENLWLLPLVDDRYWWQFASWAITVDFQTTWTELFNQLERVVDGFTAGIATVTALNDYLQPDPAELGVVWDNAAQIFDAAAHSIGCRYVHYLDGTGAVLDWPESSAAYLLNETGLDATGITPRIAGQDSSWRFPQGITPGSVSVLFPYWREGRPDPKGDTKLYEIELDDLTAEGAVEAAQQAVDNAQEAYDIAREAVNGAQEELDNATTPQEIIDATAALAAAEAELATADGELTAAQADLTAAQLLADTAGNVAPASKLIHSTCYADFSYETIGEEGVPLNDAVLATLAEQIASDFFLSLEFQYDISFPSLFEWELSGYDDSVEWCFCHRDELGYRAYTRAHSRPYNFGEETQLSQNELRTTPVFAPFQLATLQQDLRMPAKTDPPTTPGPSLAYITTAGTPGHEVNQTNDDEVEPAPFLVKVWPWAMEPGQSLKAGTTIEIRYIEELYAWYQVNVHLIRVGKVYDTAILKRTNGQVEIWGGPPGFETDSNTKETFLNQTPRNIFKNNWVGMVGNYIVTAIPPAEFVWGTTQGPMTKGNPVDITVSEFSNGDFPYNDPGGIGGTIQGLPDNTIGTQTIATDSFVFCIWSDQLQTYRVVSWSCTPGP